MGHYNMDDTLTSNEFVRNKWKIIDGNTKYDDGGDKLGQCEGFEIKGPMIFVSGKLLFFDNSLMNFLTNF